ncbi:MAG TPA: ATP synthase subunit I [Polyangiaceae bacterium]|jgi:hypothetical protein|nr:ATP synthase subunit I [Polyangiaceae bacterium]
MVRGTDAVVRGLDPRLRMSLVAVAVAGVALTFTALVLFGSAGAVSAATGAGLALGNLWGLARIVAALLPDERVGARAQSRASWALLAVLKMLTLLGVTWLLMRHGWVSPMPMLIGFLSLPIGIAIGSLVSDRTGESED